MHISLFRPQIAEEAIQAAANVLRSGWLGLGPQTEAFENASAAYTGSPHCVGLNSGTSALHLAVRLLDLTPWTEVITTALTFVSTNHDVTEVGFKYNMSDVQAAIGLKQLLRLDAENARRTSIAARYAERLSNTPGVNLLRYRADRTSSFHLFPILIENRSYLIAKVREAGIEVGAHYRRNDEYPMYDRQDLSYTERFLRSVVSLPMHLQLTDDQVDYISDCIRSGW